MTADQSAARYQIWNGTITTVRDSRRLLKFSSEPHDRLSVEFIMAHGCPICATFVAPNLPYLLSHLRLVHSHDPRFNVTCGLDGCAYTARSFSALYSHIYRKHQASGAIQPRYQGDSSLRERNPTSIEQSDGDGVSSPDEQQEPQPQDYYIQEDQFGEWY